MPDFDPSIFWPHYIASGMTKQATITSGPHDGETPYVMFDSPDLPRLDGSGRSRDYTIEYQYADLPNLAQGHTLTIGGTNYRVREAPYIKADEGEDGFFRWATLTEVRA